MRIALVTPFYPAHGGGVERVAAQLASRMAAAGAQVTWCASDTDEAPALVGVRCEPMAAFNGVERLTGLPYPLWGPRSLARLARCVRESDAVHVHDCIYASSLAAAWLARRHRKRLVVTQHIGSMPMRPALKFVLRTMNRLGARMVLRRAEGVGFISPAVQRYFESLAGASPRFHYVPNGVDRAVFHDEPGDPRARRAALGFDAQRPLLLFVGRFVAVKRLPVLRAMAALRPDWQWCVIGHGPERPQDWGLPNVRVVPAMPQGELAHYYRAADLLVLPSASEGFPLVAQEAMACGVVPCFTARVASGSELPRELWVELPSDPAGIAPGGVEAIEAWLASSPERRAALREACATHAAERWSWEAAAQAHLAWARGDAA